MEEMTLEKLAAMMQKEFAGIHGKFDELHQKIDNNHEQARGWFSSLAGQLLEIKVDHEERIRVLERKAGIR